MDTYDRLQADIDAAVRCNLAAARDITGPLGFRADGEDLQYLVHPSTREPDDERERAEIVRQIELNGCWCVAGQYRTEPDGEWEWADSVGMCIYDHPLSDAENCYIPDIISTTIDALKTALRSRCPVCRKPR